MNFVIINNKVEKNMILNFNFLPEALLKIVNDESFNEVKADECFHPFNYGRYIITRDEVFDLLYPGEMNADFYAKKILSKDFEIDYLDIVKQKWRTLSFDEKKKVYLEYIESLKQWTYHIPDHYFINRN